MEQKTQKICDVCGYMATTNRSTCPSCWSKFPTPGQTSAHTGEVVQGKRLVRFMPKTASLTAFSGWEGEGEPAPDVDEGMWRVSWRRGPKALPELVHENHLSFHIKKFSKRFA